jgi:UrcA family protein
MYRRATLIAFTTLLTLVTGCPATAQQISRVVSYHDLDLTNATGVRALRHRVARAVNLVCRLPRAGDDLIRAEDQDCRKEAANTALPKMLGAIEIAQKRAGEKQLASR